jgi:YVTN family beta-propeller protein
MAMNRLLGLRARVLTVAGLLTLSACGDSAKDPEGVALNAAEPGDEGARIYATVSGTDEVVMLDDVTHAVVGSIPVGEGPAILLHTPDFKKLYSANWENNTISAISTETNTAKPISVADRPYVIALSPDGSRLYAGLNNKTFDIAVIDTSTDQVIKSFPNDELAASIIVSADGATLYVATIGLGIGTLRAMSAEDGTIIHAPIAVGSSPAWITIGKDGSKVYTLNFLSDDVTVVDTASFTVETTIATGTGTFGIIGNVTPDGERLYVTNYGNSTLIGIDTATNEIVQTIELTGKPVGINFDREGKRLYVTDFGPDSFDESPLSGSDFLLNGDYKADYPGQISVFDRETGEQIGERVEVGPGPTSIVVVPAL